jgi:hypothetical protein
MLIIEFFFSLRQGHVMYLWLPWNTESSYLILQVLGIQTGMCHCAWLHYRNFNGEGKKEKNITILRFLLYKMDV